MTLSFQDKIKPVATPASNGNLSFADKIKPTAAPAAPLGAPATTRNALSDTPVIGQLSNFGIGAGTAIAKTLTGIPEAMSRGIGGALGGLAKIGPTGPAKNVMTSLGQQFIHNADQVAAFKEAQFTKPYQKSLETVSGQAGDITGNVAPYFLTGGAAAAEGAPLLTKIATKVPGVLADTGISAAQSGGDLPTEGATALTSAVGSMVPGGGGIAKRIVKGAVPGYVGDVSMGMAGQRGEDRKGAAAFIPGLGTALGAGFAGAGTIKSPEYKAFKDTQTAVKRTKTLTHLETNYPKVRTAIENAKAKGVDAKHILSNTDLLNGAVDNNGTVNVERAHQNFDKAVAPYEATVKQELQTSGDKISLKNLLRARDSFLKNSNLEGDAYTALKNKINANIKGLANRADKTGDIPLTRVHDAKVYSGQQRNYTDTNADNIGKEATRFLKTVVEDNASTIDVKTHNAGLSKLYAIRDVLDALGNKKVEGGRLQKHFSSLLGAYVGGHVGGPLGAIFGAESARAVTGAHMANAMGGNIDKTIQPHEGMVQSKNFGSRNRIQSNASITTTPAGITPTVLPPAPKPKPIVPITEPSRLLAEPSKATPLGGETIAGKVDASGAVIPHEMGKSGAKLVPAEKGPVAVEPKTGKFKTTYNSGLGTTHPLLNPPQYTPQVKKQSEAIYSKINEINTNPDVFGHTYNYDGSEHTSDHAITTLWSHDVPLTAKGDGSVEKVVSQYHDIIDKLGIKDNVKIGVFKMPDGKHVSIDLNVATKNRPLAHLIARLNNQDSYWDPVLGKAVKTGGTGVSNLSKNDIVKAYRGIGAFNEGDAAVFKVFKKASLKASDPTPQLTFSLDEKKAKRIANAFEKMKDEPSNPRVIKAYKALARETKSQWNALTKAGYKIEPWTGKGQPYKTSAEMARDVKDNKHLYFFPTDKGFGSGLSANHPLLADSGIVVNGKKLMYNDLFRGVHDIFGHAMIGNQFGPLGEENAWRIHSQMYGEEAKKAMTTETRGQNNWVNFGKHVLGKNIAPADRPYAEQKTGLLPDEFLKP